MKKNSSLIFYGVLLCAACVLPAQVVPGETRPIGSAAVLGSTTPTTSTDCPAEIPPTPTVPTAPVNLARYTWGTPLFPVGTESAYAVWVQHPTDANSFLAYGFNVKNRTTVFYVVGTKSRELAPFLAQVAQDFAAISSQPDSLDHSQGMTGQIDPGPGPLPDPGPGIHDIWAAAFKMYNVQQKLSAPAATLVPTPRR